MTELEVEKPVMMDHMVTISRIKDFQTGGDAAVRDEIVMGNIGLAYRMANKYKRRLEFDDALQTACLGMIRAIETFDENENTRFSTYADKCMRVKLNREIENNKATIQIPCSMQNLIREYKRVAGILRNDLDREPFADEVGEVLCREQRLSKTQHWTMKLAGEVAATIATHIAKLDRKTSKGDSGDMHRIIPDHSVRPVEVEFDLNEACEALALAMAKIDERQRKIVRMRFFEGLTLEDIARSMTPVLSRERIRQIEEETLLILKVHLNSYGTCPRRIVEAIASSMAGVED